MSDIISDAYRKYRVFLLPSAWDSLTSLPTKGVTVSVHLADYILQGAVIFYILEIFCVLEKMQK